MKRTRKPDSNAIQVVCMLLPAVYNTSGCRTFLLTFFFLSTTVAHRPSWTHDQTCATAATPPVLNPLLHKRTLQPHYLNSIFLYLVAVNKLIKKDDTCVHKVTDVNKRAKTGFAMR